MLFVKPYLLYKRTHITETRVIHDPERNKMNVYTSLNDEPEEV